VLTHAHADHTGFAERARSNSSTRIWVHGNDVRTAKGSEADPNEGPLGGYLRHAEAWRTLFGLLLHGGTRVIPILDVSAFSDGETLAIPGHPMVVHIPGHTDGMSALYAADRSALFTGDGLVTRNPLTGRLGPQIMPRGLNRRSSQALESLGKLERIPAKLVLPGHGEPWSDGAESAVAAARKSGFS